MTSHIAIIGAGIVGLTVATCIIRSLPTCRITIFDREMTGRGASFFSVGLGFPFARSPQVAELLSPIDDDWPALLSQLGIEPQLVRPLPFLGLVDRESAAETLSAFYPGTARFLPDHSRLVNLLGFDPPMRGRTSITSDRCYWGDVATLCRELATWLRQSGRVVVHEATEIVEIKEDTAGAMLRDERGNKQVYDVVVLAVGPSVMAGPAAEIASQLGLRTKKIVALHIDLPPPDRAPVVFDHTSDAFLLPQPDARRWLFSFTCEDWDVPVDTGALRITNSDLVQAGRVLESFAPALLDHLWAGRCFCDSFSPNRSAIVSPITTNSQVIFAGAASGSGFRLAPGIGSKVMDIIGGLTAIASGESIYRSEKHA